MSKTMEFRWPHEAAESVRVAGSFNSWQPQDMSFDAAEGLWKVQQDVSPGKHQFKFVVDGLWVHDENQVFVFPSFSTPTKRCIVGILSTDDLRYIQCHDQNNLLVHIFLWAN